MKFGVRTPSFKKSLKARTTGKVKRIAKRVVNPAYEKKGMGYINNPKKATTVDITKPIKDSSENNIITNNENESVDKGSIGCLAIIIVFMMLIVPLIISICLVLFLYSLGS